jgi:hypothetical protein
MMMKYVYNAQRGVDYARAYADYYRVSEDKRLFFYGVNDCTNFCSQCVWAAYGGWIPGFEDKSIEENKKRINSNIRMVPYIWYGSRYFSGSSKWCRVEEFYEFSVSMKSNGPMAYKVYEGDWKSFDPSIVNEGDVIQMVIKSYAPYRYGHCLYVTQRGSTTKQIKICCHTYDRLDTPLSEFSDQPGEYIKLRVIRFKDAYFTK